MKMKKTVLLLLVLMSFTVYLKSGKTFKTNTPIDNTGGLGMITIVIEGNKIVYIPISNIDYVKED